MALFVPSSGWLCIQSKGSEYSVIYHVGTPAIITVLRYIFSGTTQLYSLFLALVSARKIYLRTIVDTLHTSNVEATNTFAEDVPYTVGLSFLCE